MRSNHRYPALLVAALFWVSACGGGDLSLPGEVGPPADLQLVSGNDQVAPPATQLADPLLVRLVDAQGLGVPEGAVTWIVGQGGGTIAPGTTETTADGLAGTRWTLGPTPGPNTATAVVSGLPVVVFSASATGGGGGGGGGEEEPAHLVFLVHPSDVERDEKIRPAVVVAIVDQDGIVPDLSAKIEIELAVGSGELEGKRSVDTKNGFAVFDDLKLKEPGSGYVLRAFAPEEAELGSAESRAFDVVEED